MTLPPFQALLDAHGRDVHRFLTARLGPLDADDCYQETWLAALRAYPGLASSAQLRAWIFTIAHHKAIDHVRAARRRAPATEAPDTLATARPDPEVPDAELWGRVAALPDKQRAAIALRFVADAAYEEIASVMETSQEAARRNVHEGLNRLRKEYTP